MKALKRFVQLCPICLHGIMNPDEHDSIILCILLILSRTRPKGVKFWGHAIALPEYAGGAVRVLVRANEKAENLFKDIERSERRRSGRKNLTQDLEHLPAAAAISYNIQRMFPKKSKWWSAITCLNHFCFLLVGNFVLVTTSNSI